MNKLIGVIAALMLMPGMAYAQVFKCKDAGGHITYQDTACQNAVRLEIDDNLTVFKDTGLRPLEIYMLNEFFVWYNIRELSKQDITITIKEIGSGGHDRH